MSHLPVSLMNRLKQTESAVFKLWMLYFQRIPYSDYLSLIFDNIVEHLKFVRTIFHPFQYCRIYSLYIFSCISRANARPLDDTKGSIGDLFLLQQMLNAINQELSAENTGPCQPIHENPLVDESINDAPTNSDELLLIFGGYEETITETIVDKPRRGGRHHKGTGKDNRRRHARHNGKKHARRHRHGHKSRKSPKLSSKNTPANDNTRLLMGHV